MSYRDEQAQCAVQVLDKVRVTRIASSQENGWPMLWLPDMDECIGKVYVVDRIDPLKGITLKGSNAHSNINGGRDWWFPYFVLERISVNVIRKDKMKVQNEFFQNLVFDTEYEYFSECKATFLNGILQVFVYTKKGYSTEYRFDKGIAELKELKQMIDDVINFSDGSCAIEKTKLLRKIRPEEVINTASEWRKSDEKI